MDRIEIRALGDSEEIVGQDEILTPQAVGFLTGLVRELGPRVAEILTQRVAAQARYDAGELPNFRPDTADIRAGTWTVGPLPEDLLSRAVEITGPVDRKMIINALNSGADVFMADFEDSSSPTWHNTISGQINLRDAVRRTIRFAHPKTGKTYELNSDVATLMVRPRGWHLLEEHLALDGQPVPAALVDFGLFFFHNAKELMARGTGPYFYLPKLQSHLEARLWNDVFVYAQRALDIPLGTIKATVLIETLPAAFEMDEILYELREHAAGLNCGRWDYIFSYIKTLRNHPERVIPDRAQVGMTQPFMRAYTQLLIKTCHRRGAFAMGGMAAQIPIKRDAQANRQALEKVHTDKLREATDGHDGTWVAHPGLVGVAREAFASAMTGKNQLARLREDVTVTREDLLATPVGTCTEDGLRHNIRVGIQYLEAWLRGMGCVPLYDLMEDAATAEISRTQIWQWLAHGVALEGGEGDAKPLTFEGIDRAVEHEMQSLENQIGKERFAAGKFVQARELFLRVATNLESFDEFLTIPAYRALTENQAESSPSRAAAH